MLSRRKPGNTGLAYVKQSTNLLVRGAGGINRNRYRLMGPVRLDETFIVGPFINEIDNKLEGLPEASNVVGLDTHIKESQQPPSEKFKESEYKNLSGTLPKSLQKKVFEPELQPADASAVKVVEVPPQDKIESETAKLSSELKGVDKDKYVDPEKAVAPADAFDKSLVGQGEGGPASGGDEKRPKKKRPNYYDLLRKSKAEQRRKKRKLDTIIENMEFE